MEIIIWREVCLECTLLKYFSEWDLFDFKMQVVVVKVEMGEIMEIMEIEGEVQADTISVIMNVIK